MIRVYGIQKALEKVSGRKPGERWSLTFNLEFKEVGWLWEKVEWNAGLLRLMRKLSIRRRFDMRRRMRQLNAELNQCNLSWLVWTGEATVTVLVSGTISEIQVLLHRLEGRQ